MRGALPHVVGVTAILAACTPSHATSEAQPGEPAPCAEGQMAAGPDTTCRRVGVANCGAASESDGIGGCTAILPPADCEPGMFASPGEKTCHEIASCGSDTFGDVPADSRVLYVDASSTGTGDGSRARPFSTIQAAIDASPGGIVAIAAGTYEENLKISKRVRLFGRCPSKVSIRGKDASTAALSIFAAGVEVHRVAITGPSAGVRSTAADAVLQQVLVHDAEPGVDVRGGRLAVNASLVRGSRWGGVVVNAGLVAVESSVVRDGKPDSAGAYGGGVYATMTGTAEIKRTLIDANHHVGLSTMGATATLEDCVVRNTTARSDGKYGRGINAQATSATRRAKLTVRRTLVERNTNYGIALYGAIAAIEDAVVRDTVQEPATKAYGTGLYVGVEAGSSARSEVVVSRSVFERNRDTGIGVFGSVATLEEVLIRDTLAGEKGTFGRGISVTFHLATMTPSELVLRRSFVARNRESGVAVFASTATIEDTVVTETRAQESDNLFGDGFLIVGRSFGQTQFAASATIAGSVSSRNARLGVGVFGDASLQMNATRLLCHDPALAAVGSTVMGAPVEPRFEGDTSNQCGCESLGACKLEREDARDITPPDPAAG